MAAVHIAQMQRTPTIKAEECKGNEKISELMEAARVGGCGAARYGPTDPTIHRMALVRNGYRLRKIQAFKAEIWSDGFPLLVLE